MTMPKSPTIEALRGAIERWEFAGWQGGTDATRLRVRDLVGAARALVAEFDEQVAYVQFLRDHPPSADDVRRLMTDTDPATVDRVVSTMREPVPSVCQCPGYRFPGDPNGIDERCPVHGFAAQPETIISTPDGPVVVDRTPSTLVNPGMPWVDPWGEQPASGGIAKGTLDP